MAKKKRIEKRLSHEQVLAVYSTIRFAISTENSDDLKVYLDASLAELCRRRGVVISAQNVAYHRYKIGIVGYAKRLKKLIQESRNNPTEETI